MSIKWVLPWWLADPTNCLSLAASSSFLHLYFASFPSSSCSPAIFHMEEQGMGLCAVGPLAPCQRWLLRLFPQPRFSSETPRSPFSTLGCKRKMDIKHVCVSVCWGAHIDHRSVNKYIGLSGYEFHPVWGHSTGMQDWILGNIQHHNPMCTSQTWAQKHARSDTHSHTCTLADNYPSGEQNAHVGPITALDKGHGTPKTLLLCLSPMPCVCFAWLNELDLWLFAAFCSLCIPVVLKNA